MNLTRRSFLQSLAALTGGAALNIHPVADPVEAAPVLEAPIEPAVLDAPVTVANPLAWLELDGDRYALTRWDIQLRRDVQPVFFDGRYGETAGFANYVKGPMSWTINCDLVGPTINPFYYFGRELPMRISSQGIARIYQGNVQVQSCDTIVDLEGVAVNGVHLEGIGELAIA